MTIALVKVFEAFFRLKAHGEALFIVMLHNEVSFMQPGVSLFLVSDVKLLVIDYVLQVLDLAQFLINHLIFL